VRAAVDSAFRARTASVRVESRSLRRPAPAQGGAGPAASLQLVCVGRAGPAASKATAGPVLHCGCAAHTADSSLIRLRQRATWVDT
jgi:hypothetical protein